MGQASYGQQRSYVCSVSLHDLRRKGLLSVSLWESSCESGKLIESRITESNGKVTQTYGQASLFQASGRDR